jgi:hypothetical protein
MSAAGSALTRLRQMDLQDFVQAEWPRAVEDAGLDPDGLAYWIAEESPPEIRDRGAMYFRPGQDPDPPYAFSAEQLAAAVSPAFADRHRIVVHADYELPGGLSEAGTEAYFAAVIRHELEHARQGEVPEGKAALEIDQRLVDEVLAHKAGGISGGAVFYNYKPMEMDANAAASIYIRERFPDTVEELLRSPIANMARSNTRPEPPSSLLVRTVCFLFQFRSIAESLAEPLPFSAHLRTYGGEEAARIWDQLSEVAGEQVGPPNLAPKFSGS